MAQRAKELSVPSAAVGDTFAERTSFAGRKLVLERRAASSNASNATAAIRCDCPLSRLGLRAKYNRRNCSKVGRLFHRLLAGKGQRSDKSGSLQSVPSKRNGPSLAWAEAAEGCHEVCRTV